MYIYIYSYASKHIIKRQRYSVLSNQYHHTYKTYITIVNILPFNSLSSNDFRSIRIMKICKTKIQL